MLRGIANSFVIRPSLALRRSVHKWSPLAIACNTKLREVGKKERIANAAQPKQTGLFGYEPLKTAGGFEVMRNEVKERVDDLLGEALSDTRERKMVEVLDEMSDTLCKVADLADFVRSAHPDAGFRDAADSVWAELCTLVEVLNTHSGLYAAARSAFEHSVQSGSSRCDDVDRRVLELLLFDFEQSGISLPRDKRRQFVSLNDAALRSGAQFVAGVASIRSTPEKSLPERLRRVLDTAGGQVRIAHPYADAANELVREAAYKCFYSSDSRQEAALRELVTNRLELAKLSGFDSYAERAARNSLAESVSPAGQGSQSKKADENVKLFLETCSRRVAPLAERDFAFMRVIKRSFPASTSATVNAWDVPYLVAVARQQRSTEYSADDLLPYFSIGAAFQGLSNLLGSLFNVHLEFGEAVTGETWHDLVFRIDVRDRNARGTLLGHIYCDLFEREGKPLQDCHYTIRGGRQLSDGSYQTPIVVLLLNFTSPARNRPSLLTLGQLENLFHEFGHAMHSMLGRTRYQHVTGTRCTTDFAEVPSVLFEYFVYDPRVLATIASHYETGERLSSAIIDDIANQRSVFLAADKQQQIMYSILDQRLHSAKPLESGETTTNVLQRTWTEHYTNVPYPAGNAWQHRFSHLVGYGAKYYSYLLSRAVAHRIWLQLFKGDPFDGSMGERYRRELLAFGGEKRPAELIQNVLGQQLTMDELANSLVEECSAAQARYLAPSKTHLSPSQSSQPSRSD